MRAVPILALSAILALGVAASAQAAPTEPTLVVSGGYYAPRFSPDGSQILVTGERYQGLFLARTAGVSAPQKLVDDERAGVDARFLADGTVSFQSTRAGAMRRLVIDTTRQANLREAAPATEVAFAHEDRVYVRTAKGLVSAATGDRFFAPVSSPDGRYVAFLGLATGIYVYDRETAQLTHVGTGTAPAWSPDSKTLIFERTLDDGHVIIGSDLFLWSPGARVRALSVTPGRLERRPAFAPNGKTIAFDDDRGAVYLQALSVEVTR